MGILSTLRILFQREGRYKDKPFSDHHNPSSIKKNNTATMNLTESLDQSSVSSPDGSTRNQSSSNGTTFRYMDGRRYHGDEEAVYVLPNDDDGLWIVIVIISSYSYKNGLCI